MKLKPELIPKPLSRISAYRLLGRSTAWKRIRADALEACNRCEICGAKPSGTSGDSMTCHEVWSYDNEGGVATLVGLRIQCAACDIAVHMGRAMKRGLGKEAMHQLCKVNEITPAEAKALYDEAMRIWQIRNQIKWRISVEPSLIARYPELVILQGLRGHPIRAPGDAAAHL